MTALKTKKILTNIGAILGIVISAILIFAGFIFLICSSVVTYDFVVETLQAESTFSQYTVEEIELIANITKNIFNFATIYCLAIGISGLVVSILLNVRCNTNKNTKGLVIALMILSFLIGDIIVAGLMIAVLYINPKPEEILKEMNANSLSNTTDDTTTSESNTDTSSTNEQ